ncbi:hypothetical protein [Clostridium beijerinckii]|uniref:hypothetical protein n=1 Tax=Clostridium beijerinckii TaxID=1520 RepID=UPI0015704779|nr:hypothetical protein [Clostridium beijerinckii]
MYQPSYPFLLHLTPGTHRIDVKAADPNYMSSAIKDDFINVTIPTAITTSAVTVKQYI